MSKILIRNANVFTGEYRFEKADVQIEGDRITAISAVLQEDADVAFDEVIDADGLFLIPGLVDIHFHGAMGADFCDGTEEALEKICAYEAQHGILAVCPATMTIPEDDLLRVMQSAREFAEKQEVSVQTASAERAALIGINMEGPFISASRVGAQNPAYICAPDVVLYRKMQEASGNLIKLVDLAPETEGAMELIDEVKDEVCISLAHMTAGYETACEAFEHGARHMTHLFNAMPGLQHREPGPIAAAFDHHAEVELITDGIHLHDAMVRLAFALFDPDKVILISDSMEATGLPDGEYQLGGQKVVKRGKKAVLSADGSVIAGSVTNLFDCMKHAVKGMGIPMEAAVRAATVNPARAIGAADQYGSIEAGKKANLVLMDPDMNIVKIINRGSLCTVRK